MESIEIWNRDLGCRFIRELRHAKGEIAFITPVSAGRPPSGLVTIEVQNENIAKQLVRTLEIDDRYAFSVLHGQAIPPNIRQHPRYRLANLMSDNAPRLEEESPSGEGEPANTQLRFCFHYYHEADDVRRLASSILEAIK